MEKKHSKEMSKEKMASFLALLSFTAYMPVSCLPAFAADIAANTLPEINSAVNGTTNTSGNKMDVTVTGGKGTVGQFDWNSFNVGKDATVNWVFSANSQTALNRVLASGGMSYIYGKLTSSSANGCASCVNTSKVILINPSGILFGNGSSVDLNSFTASTYDIKGAKNLSELTEKQLKDYAGEGGESGALFNIAGYNKTVEFVANDNMVDGNGYITADAAGTKLASIIAEGADIKANKSIAFVGNKIDISNSNLTTTYQSDPNASNYTQTKSNVKLVTGDGVNFYYTSAGNIDNNVFEVGASKTANDTSEYGISVTDSKIQTGSFLAYNGAEEGSIDIDGSTIYTKKLLGKSYTSSSGVQYDATETGTSGNIEIISKGTVNIENSDIQTTNDVVVNEDGTLTNITNDIAYGNMTIEGAKGVNITNSDLRTADSTANTENNITAGNISISSSAGDVNITQDKETESELYNNSAIAASGDLTIAAAGDVTIDGYDKIQASGNGISTTSDRTITVSASNVNFEDTLLNAKNLAVKAADAINVKDTSVVADNTSLIGSDTTIDGSLLQYKELAFYNSSDSDAQINNVTIKNNTTLYDTDSSTLKIATNGNLTLDNEDLQTQKYGSAETSRSNAIELESTQGNISIENGSEVRSNSGDVDIIASNGSIDVDSSSVYAASGDTTLTAKDNIAVDNSTVWAKDGDTTITSGGKVTALNSKIAAENGNTTISQKSDIDIDEDFKGSMVGATEKLTLETEGDIKGDTLTAGTGYINYYTDLVSLNNDNEDVHFVFKGAELNAQGGIAVTDLQSAKDVDFIAGKNIDLDSTGNMKLTDVSTSAEGATDITAAGDLVTEGFEIVKGKKTTLTGAAVMTAEDTVIATNENKLAVNADTKIDIAVTGVTNADNGLEINADVNTSAGSNPLEGKTVKVDAKDGTLAISKIKADTLDLTANTILAGSTTISSAVDNVSGLDEADVSYDSKAYIEIRTDGGFNLDATTDYNEGNSGIYTGGSYGNYVTDTTTLLGDVYDEITNVETSDPESSRELVSTERVETGIELDRTEAGRVQAGESTTETIYGEDGYTIVTTTPYDITYDVTYQTDTINTYQNKETTTTTTTTTTYQDYETTTTSKDQQHIATLNQEEQDAFVLVYGKTSTDTVTGTNELDTNTKTDTVTVDVGEPYSETEYGTGSTIKQETVRQDIAESTFCEYEDEVEPDLGWQILEVEPDDSIAVIDIDPASLVRNPRHAEGTSDTVAIQNDLADTSSTVVAAAARLDLADEDDTEDDSDENGFYID